MRTTIITKPVQLQFNRYKRHLWPTLTLCSLVMEDSLLVYEAKVNHLIDLFLPRVSWGPVIKLSSILTPRLTTQDGARLSKASWILMQVRSLPIEDHYCCYRHKAHWDGLSSSISCACVSLCCLQLRNRRPFAISSLVSTHFYLVSALYRFILWWFITLDILLINLVVVWV